MQAAHTYRWGFKAAALYRIIIRYENTRTHELLHLSGVYFPEHPNNLYVSYFGQIIWIPLDMKASSVS